MSSNVGSSEPSGVKKTSKRPKSGASSVQASSYSESPSRVILTFLVAGVVFIPLGVICLFASQGVELVDRYDTDCVPESSRGNKVAYIQGQGDKMCNRTITVTKTTKHPVYVYYQLENFYQNHRRYVKSRNDAQLRSPREECDVQTCAPEDNVAGHPIVPWSYCLEFVQ